VIQNTLRPPRKEEGPGCGGNTVDFSSLQELVRRTCVCWHLVNTGCLAQTHSTGQTSCFCLCVTHWAWGWGDHGSMRPLVLDFFTLLDYKSSKTFFYMDLAWIPHSLIFNTIFQTSPPHSQQNQCCKLDHGNSSETSTYHLGRSKIQPVVKFKREMRCFVGLAGSYLSVGGG
jgi:hypothetical protein